MKHEVKILPQYFCRVMDGSKTFEVRNNDRGYQPGDEITLKEYDQEIATRHEGEEYWGFTLKEKTFKIGYVLPIDAQRVVFSLLELK